MIDNRNRVGQMISIVKREEKHIEEENGTSRDDDRGGERGKEKGR